MYRLRKWANIWFWAILCWAPNLYAQSNAPEAPSLGGLATNMLGPLGALTDIFYNICYILGGSLLLGAVVQYKAHRINPSQVRFSQPIFLAVLGLVFIALPYISQLSSAARTVHPTTTTATSTT